MMTLKDFINQLRKIEYHMRTHTQEAIAGSYHSAFKGHGMTFTECKPYEQGDDVRYIDWHASARHQSLFVRQCIEERELNVCIIMDLSKSMQFGSIARTKAETAIEAMSVIAYSALKNNDKVSLFLFDDNGTKFIPNIRGSENVIRLIIESLHFKAKDCPTSMDRVLAKSINLLKRKSLVFILSDFLDNNYIQPLKHLAHKHDVIPLTIIDPMESEMPDLGMISLDDGMNSTFIDTGNQAFQKEYEERFSQRMSEQKSVFDKIARPVIKIYTHKDIVRPIAHIFEKRSNHV